MINPIFVISQVDCTVDENHEILPYLTELGFVETEHEAIIICKDLHEENKCNPNNYRVSGEEEFYPRFVYQPLGKLELQEDTLI